MGFLDRFRRKPRHHPAVPPPSKEATSDLLEFLRDHDGVEGFVEPRTAVYPMSLCLVDGDGANIRRSIRDEEAARKLCAEHGVPLYDARIVGYPKRMREYQEGMRRERVSLDELPPLDVVGEEPRRERDARGEDSGD